MTTREHLVYPVVYSREVNLNLVKARTSQSWETRLDDFLSSLASSLRSAGCSLIGHIKGILETGEDSRLFFSLTNFQGPPHFKGHLVEASMQGRLTINVIVYGIEETILKGIMKEEITRQFGLITRF
jgi:hypothetical protein